MDAPNPTGYTITGPENGAARSGAANTGSGPDHQPDGTRLMALNKDTGGIRPALDEQSVNLGEDGSTAPARKPLSKKLRFEVFKRDAFTCQYCGAKAPDVVLHADHVVPVSKGGGSDPLNLVTACAACNQGKGARELSDDAAITVSRKAAEQKAERIEQIQMLAEWRASLGEETDLAVEAAVKAICAFSNYSPNANGRLNLRKWIKQFGLDEVLAAIDIAFPQYLIFDADDKVTPESWENAFKKISGIVVNQRKARDNPKYIRILYCIGILRSRFNWVPPELNRLLEEACALDLDVESAIAYAKTAPSRNAFRQSIINFIVEQSSAADKGQE